jgi:cytochrome c553
VLTDLRLASQLAVVLVLAACGGSEERGPDSADLRDPWALPATPGDASLALGKQIFASCASCHLADAGGRTDGTIPRLAGQAASTLERRLRALSDGSVYLPVMTPFARALTEPEIRHVSAYLSSLPRPAQVGIGSGRQLARGLAIYGDRCGVCHAENGSGAPSLNAPRLCGQHEAYLLRRLNEMAGTDPRGADPAMSAIAAALSPEDRRAVSDHLARLRCD